jgi:hypothetical protein
MYNAHKSKLKLNATLIAFKTLLALPDSYIVIVESDMTLDDILSHGKGASVL